MEPPKVTGLSPKEGEPGTKVIIRGENLGTSQRDLLSILALIFIVLDPLLILSRKPHYEHKRTVTKPKPILFFQNYVCMKYLVFPYNLVSSKK